MTAIGSVQTTELMLRYRARPRRSSSIGIAAHWIALAMVLAGATAVRLGWALASRPTPESDFLTFYQTGQLIAAGQWWPQSYGWSWQGPLYPLLIAPLTLLGNSSLPAISLLNAGLGVGTVGLVYSLGSSLFRPAVGIAASAAVAFFPGIWLYTPLVAAENLSLFLVVAIAALLARLRGPRHLFIIGSLTGMLPFVRPSLLLMAIVVSTVIVGMAERGRRRTAIVLVAAGVILTAGPFALVNAQAGGPTLPIGASGWQPWLVYNEHATGAWFPAGDETGYPLRGVPAGAEAETLVRAGQQKLALQFVALNPARAAISVAERHILSWASDRSGLDWTLSSNQSGVPASVLEAIVDNYYLGVLALAVWGATHVRTGRIMVVGVLPIVYIVSLPLIGEGNARYHLTALPFLALFAGAAILRLNRRRAILLIEGLVLVLLAPRVLPVAPSLVLAVIVAAGVTFALAIWGRTRRSARFGRPRQRHLLVAVLAVAALEVTGSYAASVTADAIRAWTAVSPAGWHLYTGADSEAATDPAPDTRALDEASGLRKVSFPDAAILPASNTSPTIGLTRTFPELELGQPYVLYLQVFDPGLRTAQDVLLVRANGRTIWERTMADGSEPGWAYVSSLWVADAPFVTLQVERRATGSTAGAEILVRSPHVYPEY